VFREPVDPIALGIPQYHGIIPKKDSRDLKTIRSKLDNDRYESVDAFEADLDLMVDNAVTFNGEDSDVGLVAANMRGLYRRLTSEWRSNLSKKRKDNDQSTPQPAKRAKTS
jgi:transcription initiation factor TFIID subunit 2